MSSNANIKEIIEKRIKRVMLFSNINHQGKKPIVVRQSVFKSSEQIENNLPSITHQISKQLSTSLHKEWPQSCIGLVLCEHRQNNQTFYVYGTGTLTYNNIVLTSGQNVYCRRLQTEYTNIKFITGVNGNKCNGIYDAKRIHYPKEYTLQDYQNYDFAVLYLYDDLSESYGYVGLEIVCKPESKHLNVYGYLIDNQLESFNLSSIKISRESEQKWKVCLGSGVLVKEEQNKQSIVRGYMIFSQKIRDMINQWIYLTEIDLNNIILLQVGNKIFAQGCKYLNEDNFINLYKINIRYNNFGAKGCKYLIQANWTHLTKIYLNSNNIGVQGCNHLSRANWMHLTTIGLSNNSINAQGCKYLIKANWIHLKEINLHDNNIDAQGCKYLSQTNWTYLSTIYLGFNDICTQGCRHLSQVYWKQLKEIQLRQNKIENLTDLLPLQEYWSKLRNQYDQ